MITLRKLVPPENATLFKRFPELNLIWEVPALQAQARESYEEWGDSRKPEESTGEIFAVLEGEEAVGIIGWFEYDKAGADIARLRYYGIIPSRRGRGFAEKAMRLLLERLAEAAPARYLWLAESVSTERAAAPLVLAHFKKMGFEEFTDPHYGENAGCGPTQSLRIRIPGR
jgi:ribosomal protein S18 acetylase RimI-like enzyme